MKISPLVGWVGEEKNWYAKEKCLMFGFLLGKIATVNFRA